MLHTSFLHTCIAAVLLVAMLFLMTTGFVAAKPAHGEESPSLSQQTEGYSFTARKGTGSENQPLESSHYDHNPSCCHDSETLVYYPEVTLLFVSEPFTAVSPVYLDRFIPPLNIV